MKNNAITLISLVITIILLIILAGIAINLSLGENGLFIKAKQAKEKYINEQVLEEKSINDLYSQIMIATNDSSEITVSIEDLKKIIKEEVQKEVKERDTAPIFIDFDNLLTTITTQGTSWEATEDCAIICDLAVKDAMTASVTINDVTVSAICNQSSSNNSYTNTVQVVYAKKGSVIKTRENYGIYDIKIYGLK